MHGAVQEVALLLAGAQRAESAVGALEGLGAVEEVLGLPRVLDAEADVDAVVALVEKRAVLADDAMAVGAVVRGQGGQGRAQQEDAQGQGANDRHAFLLQDGA
ncbi:hypothetical protein D3C72_1843380 [compost metagenome]